MPKLVINPGGPTAREFHLKPGSNHIGRSNANDVHLEDPSVSGSHCQILVDDQGVIIRDLGSTNGTYINRAPVKEARLENGQAVRFGGVEMVYYSDSNATVTAPRVPPPPPAPVPAAAPRLSIGASSRGATAVAPPPALRTAASQGDTEFVEPPAAPPVAPVPMGPAFCKFHPKSPARWQCPKCNRGFCDVCISARNVGGVSKKTCRSCGVEVRPLQVRYTRTVERGFFSRLPGAFAYPFLGTGVFLLLAGMLIFAGLKFGSVLVGSGNLRGVGMGVVMQIMVGGYLFTYLQTIIHTTAVGDERMPDLPGMSNIIDDILMPFLRLFGLVSICFGPAIGLTLWAVFGEELLLLPIALGAWIIAAIYFPMALLAVAMLDNLMAVNPMMVVPSIFRAPLEYLVTLILVGAAYATSKLGDLALLLFFPEGFSSPSIPKVLLLLASKLLLAFVNIYLLVVTMRLLGLLYVTKKEKLGWP